MYSDKSNAELLGLFLVSNQPHLVHVDVCLLQVMRIVESNVKDNDSGKFRFCVRTMNRNYMFAAESLGNCLNNIYGQCFVLILV